MKTIIEVGTNTGDDSLIFDCFSNGYYLYMFEPDPKCVIEVQEKIRNFSNMEIHEMAISSTTGETQFNIANHSTCSSLLEFDPTVNNFWVDERHPYKEFKTIKIINVKTIRLDHFMNKEAIDQVDFLYIDAQGSDLEVVRSLGKRILDVKRIQIEVVVFKHHLYTDSFSKDEAIKFFSAKKFVVESIEKQSLGREENITFVNSTFDD